MIENRAESFIRLAIRYKLLVLARKEVQAGTFQGICNGDATSLERFTEPHMHLFHGMLVATVRSGHKPGTITVKISTASGISQTISIAVK